jgi:hypothetical protein
MLLFRSSQAAWIFGRLATVWRVCSVERSIATVNSFVLTFDPHEPADAIDVISLETIIAFGLQPLLELIIVRRMPPRMTSCLHANNEEKGNIDSKRLERHALKDCKPHQIACQIEPLSKKAITDKTHRAESSPY